jgi:putative cell wall-binding protein
VLNVTKVYLVGGPAAVGEVVATQLRGAGLTVERLFGADRFATSAQVASTWGALPSRRIYVADGSSFTDQIVAAGLASADKSPLLLWGTGDRGSSLIAAEVQRLRATEIVAVGAGASGARLQAVVPAGTRVTTLTADSPAALSVASLQIRRTQPAGLMLVTEKDFADALAATPIAAGRSMHLLLTPVTCVMPGVAQVLNETWVSNIVVVGGPHAVSPAALETTGVCL